MRNCRTKLATRVVPALGLAVFFLLSAPAPAEAQTEGGPFGLGIILGEPTGLTGKVWFTDEQALQFHLAWDFSDDAFGIYIDYLFHFQPWRSPSSRFDLPMYVGPGGKLLFHDHDHGHWHNHHWDDDDHVDIGLGIRVPVGIAMLFQRAPVELFLEIAVGILLIPDTDPDLDGGIGVRYYF